MQLHSVTALLDRMLGFGAVMFIHTYRLFLSPIKGFCCAHNALHNTGSCSDYALIALKEAGLAHGYRRIKTRLADCKLASLSFNTVIGDEFRRRDPSQHKRKSCPNSCKRL